MQTKSYYALVYQAGIANVFKCEGNPLITRGTTKRKRVLQGDFRPCGNFCLGLAEMGARIVPAWCNEAGDIASRVWNFQDFDEAPFSEQFVLAFNRLSNVISNAAMEDSSHD